MCLKHLTQKRKGIVQMETLSLAASQKAVAGNETAVILEAPGRKVSVHYIRRDGNYNVKHPLP